MREGGEKREESPDRVVGMGTGVRNYGQTPKERASKTGRGDR